MEVKNLTVRERILLGADAIMHQLNNENAIGSWLACGVPDGADDEEILAMANDDEEFAYCVSLFLDIMKRKSVYEDGLYFSRNRMLITADSRKEDS